MDPDTVSNRIQELDNTLAAMFPLLVWELDHQTINCIGYITLENWIVMWTNVGILLMQFKSELNQAVHFLDHLNFINYNNYYVLQLDSCITRMQFSPARVIRFASSAF